MGAFQEYIQANLGTKDLQRERKSQLKRIGEKLDCDVLVFASRLSVPDRRLAGQVSINYDDLVPFVEQVKSCKKDRLALILETPGGIGEVGRQMMEILHEQFQHIIVIVPGSAKSTGTIMALGAHEIMMGLGSALGPIDAQLSDSGKTYSADALLVGLDRIKKEVDESGNLNKAYIPFLQKLSPGELEHARNALEFARATVREWLVKYKFGKWTHRKGSGDPVTPEYKKERAKKISDELAKQSKWHTHGRSIRIGDLRNLGLEIVDYSKQEELADAIDRYHVLLNLTFSTNVLKIIETVEGEFARRFQQSAPSQTPPAAHQVPEIRSANVSDFKCEHCGNVVPLQLDFLPGQKLAPGSILIDKSLRAKCPHCSKSLDLRPVLDDVVKQVGKPPILN